MARPVKCRRIACNPTATHFNPAGSEGLSAGEEIVLALDEYEALRLCDLQSREQKPAAACMKISRQTLGNILRSARRKLADCIINGKPLMIAGGEITLPSVKLRCCDCGSGWTTVPGAPQRACPRCGGDNVQNCPRRQCCKFKPGGMACLKIKGETK